MASKDNSPSPSMVEDVAISSSSTDPDPHQVTPTIVSTSDQSYNSTPELDHNPEPPSELLDRQYLILADRIGDTVYSKHWLFTTLMKLIQIVEKKQENDGAEQEDVKDEFDLDEDLQDELCQIWDMSMNKEVVNFLQEFKTVDILTGVIAKSRYPRATEICVGILGNMGCNNDACHEMAAKKKLIDLVALLLSEVDAPTLVETMRLLQTVISNREHRQPWLEMIKTEQQFLQRLNFILSSSTNGHLLRNTAMFLDKLLDIEEGLCSSWATKDTIAALIETAKQIGCQPGAALDTVFHVLQLFSTTEPGVTVLVEQQEELCQLFLQYLLYISSDEIPGVEGHENSLASAFSILNVIFVSSSEACKIIFQDYALIRCLLKILEVVYTKLHPKRHHDQLSQKRRRSRISQYTSITQSSPLTDTTNNIEADATTERAKPSGITHGNPGTGADSVDTHGKNRPTMAEPEEEGSGHAGTDVVCSGDGTQQGKDGGEKTEEEEEEVVAEEEYYDATRLCVLYEVLQVFSQDVTTMFTTNEKEEVARSLLYCETGCPRDRLYAMVWTMVDENRAPESTDNSPPTLPTSKGLQLVAALHKTAEKHELKRLSGILNDALAMYPNNRQRVSK